MTSRPAPWCAPMAALVLASAGLAVAAAGCEAEPRAASWRIDLGPGVLERAVVVEARIARGSCAGPAEYQEELRVDRGMAPPAPPVLGPGPYCFAARARDAGCLYFASGEVTVDLPLSTSDPVIVVVNVGGAETDACAGGACLAGTCADPDAGPARDAGPGDASRLDADRPPMDAEPPPRDAGPPPPPDTGPPPPDTGPPPPRDAGPPPDSGGPCARCTPSQACVGGACVQTCRIEGWDPACPLGTFCQEGWCLAVCGSGGGCPAGHRCNADGLCALDDCTTLPGSCPSGLMCRLTTLTCGLPCTVDADCPTGHACRGWGGGSTCRPRCAADADCPAGARCEVLPGGSMACAYPCMVTTDCPGPPGLYRCNVFDYCEID